MGARLISHVVPYPNRSVPARRRFLPAGRGSARRRRRRRGLAPPRHHGRAFRSQHLLRAGAGPGAASPCRHPLRCPPDDRPGRSLSGGLRGSRRRPDQPAPGSGAASAPVAADHPGARQKGRCGAEPGDARQRDRLRARPLRPGAGHVGQSGLRWAVLHSVPAGQDRRAAVRDRSQRARHRAAGRWRRHGRDGAGLHRGRRGCAGGRHGGVRQPRLRRRHRRDPGAG